MSKVFKVWLDSGADIHSRYEQTISLDDAGVSDEDWERMTDDEKEEVMKDFAWDRMEWGYTEVAD